MSPHTWNFFAPLLLAAGVLAQAACALRPRLPFALAGAGAAAVVAYALHERDITLAVGQALVLPLLWRRRRQP